MAIPVDVPAAPVRGRPVLIATERGRGGEVPGPLGERCSSPPDRCAILDNYAAHKHPEVTAWLARHPCWTFHLTPTSCPWPNAVEGFFATSTERRLKRGDFASPVELQAAIDRHNADPRPFVWTAEPDGIIEKVRRGYRASRSAH